MSLYMAILVEDGEISWDLHRSEESAFHWICETANVDWTYQLDGARWQDTPRDEVEDALGEVADYRIDIIDADLYVNLSAGGNQR